MDPFDGIDVNMSDNDYAQEAWEDRHPEPTPEDWREYEQWLDEQEAPVRTAAILIDLAPQRFQGVASLAGSFAPQPEPETT